MKNQTFTYLNGQRPGKIIKAQNEEIKQKAVEFISDFNVKNQRHPTETELARGLKISTYKAGSVLNGLRHKGVIEKRGRVEKPKSIDIHQGELRYIVCSVCHERTCARAAHSETLRGWTHVDVQRGSGVCHACSKARLEAVAK